VKVVWVILATAAAVALQTTLDRWIPLGTVDLVLIVVVYFALTSGRVTGMLTGTFAGLVQDALSGAVIGMAGLSKTVVGFAAGVVGTQFIVAHSFSRFVVFMLASLVDQLIFRGLYEGLGLRHFGWSYAQLAGHALGNAVLGVLLFKLTELLPGAVERRRHARGLRR